MISPERTTRISIHSLCVAIACGALACGGGDKHGSGSGSGGSIGGLDSGVGPGGDTGGGAGGVSGGTAGSSGTLDGGFGAFEMPPLLKEIPIPPDCQHPGFPGGDQHLDFDSVRAQLVGLKPGVEMRQAALLAE